MNELLELLATPALLLGTWHLAAATAWTAWADWLLLE
jgi:hypothetical protein